MGNDLDKTTSDTLEEIEQKPAKNWVLWLIVLLAAILGHGIYFSKNITTDFGYLFGYNLMITLLLFFSFRGLMGKDNKENITDKTLPLVFLIFVTLMVASHIGADRNHAEARLMTQAIKERYSAVMAEGYDEKGYPRIANENLDVTPKSRGDMGVAEQFVKTYWNGYIAIQNDYLRTLDDMRWDTLLDANRLKADPSLAESRKMIADAHLLVAVYGNKFILYTDSGPDKINALSVDQDFKRSMLRGFEKGMADGRRRMKRAWEYEAKTVAEMEVVINLLASRKGHWGAEDGKLVFSSQSDLDEFNASIKRIEGFTKAQSALLKESDGAVNGALKIAK